MESASAPPTNRPPNDPSPHGYPHSQAHQARQQRPAPAQTMNGVNGANMAASGGGGGGGGALPAGPAPAGHQAELNYIYGMVEELSKQLADNRRVTEDIVSGLGRVRTRAKSHDLSNEALIDAAAPELELDRKNLDTLVSILSESLEKATHSRDANASLLSQYASALALMLKQFHEYKARHTADVGAWHRSYRVQLDEERRENSRLREQIWEMQAHAGRANESLRQLRRKVDDDPAQWDGRVEAVAARQELRFWKRMAMPELEDDDPYWSADDDIIDVAEKERLQDLETRAIQEQMMDDEAEALQHHHQQQMLMGGIAMQRDDGRPVPPAWPLSAASSTGSTSGQ